MSPLARFYLDQVAICERSALGAKLANEREKFQRSQEAWQALADRTIAVTAARAIREGKA